MYNNEYTLKYIYFFFNKISNEPHKLDRISFNYLLINKYIFF